LTASAGPGEGYGAAMGRLSDLTRDELDERGKKVWDAIVGTRGDLVVSEQGSLYGPFNAFVHAPEVGGRMVALGKVLRFETSIDNKLLELAVITVGARWKAEFEWWAHARMALAAGVAQEVVDAIGRGEAPPFDSEDQQTVHAVARQLSETGHLDDHTYHAAHQLLGETGLVELVSLCGYYAMISFVLNAFDVPVPPGETPMWSDEPA